ncbi:MAG: hypothetical protein PVF43_00405 [Candidatus Eiseniibacteriota bacterium]|jgi:hypothetical protein
MERRAIRQHPPRDPRHHGTLLAVALGIVCAVLRFSRSWLDGETGPQRAPTISPGGRYVACCGGQDLFTLDLLLADLERGKIVTRLASSNSDEHFDALRFTDSDGAWSPDGRRFAFYSPMVGQLYAAYPFQRPGAGWQFGFVLLPGW